MTPARLRAGCTAVLVAACLAASGGALAQGTAFAGSADEAAVRQVHQSGRGADEVYRALVPLESRYAGDADYDYALGASALDSGRYSHAVLVLRRAVAARPAFAGARMELARAHFALGDNEPARREFEILQGQSPPAATARVIADYLAAIDRRASAYRPQRSWTLDLGAGYDSNANGAPDLRSFIDIPLDSRSQSTSSAYYSLGLGGSISHPFAPGWRLLGAGSADHRGHPDASFVDSQALRAAGGIEWRPGSVGVSLQPGFGAVLLDGEDNHQVAGVDLAGTWYGAAAQASLVARSGRTRYADGLEILDVDTGMFGLVSQFAPRSMPRVQFAAGVTFGTDDAVEAGSPYGRDLVGGRLGMAVSFASGALTLSVASVTSDYDGVFITGAREDDQLGGSLGYDWNRLRARGWVIRGQVHFVDNQSTVALYDYDRIEAGVAVRKEFR